MLPRLTVLQASSVPKIKVVHIQRLLTHQSVYFEGKEFFFYHSGSWNSYTATGPSVKNKE